MSVRETVENFGAAVGAMPAAEGALLAGLVTRMQALGDTELAAAEEAASAGVVAAGPQAPELTESEGVKPDLTESEGVKPDLTESEGVKPDLSESEGVKPDLTESE